MTERCDGQPIPIVGRSTMGRLLIVSLMAFTIAFAAGCAPGSGGTGYPDAGVVPSPDPDQPLGGDSPTGSPAPSPSPSSPPTPPAMACANLAADDIADAQRAADPYQGSVRAIESGCLLVGERWIDVTTAVVVTRSGETVGLTALVAGAPVTVEPDPVDPRRANRVVLETG